MAWKIKLLCKHCGEKFSWEHEEFPDECPLCNTYIGPDGKPTIAAPYISLKSARSADGVYKAMERGADHRATVAAEMLGIPKAETGLQITDFKEAKYGESSAPQPTVSREMAQAMAAGTTARLGLQVQDVAQVRQMTQNQPFAGSGLAMQSVIRQRHSQYAPVNEFPTATPRR